MNIEQIEKDLGKFQKLATNLDKDISVNEGKIQSVMERLKKEFNVTSIEEAEKMLGNMTTEVKSLEEEISRRMGDLNDKYGDLI
jgi:predicted  nucleic acid-binding Zn-ribbon protein